MKLNVLHWHLCDAHSFPFGSIAVPSSPPTVLTTPRSYTRALRCAPWSSPPRVAGSESCQSSICLRTRPRGASAVRTSSWHARGEWLRTRGLEHGINKAALDPMSETTYEVIELLLAELAEVFPDEYVHLGGDEVDGDCWLTSPSVAAWARSHARRSGAIGSTRCRVSSQSASTRSRRATGGAWCCGMRRSSSPRCCPTRCAASAAWSSMCGETGCARDRAPRHGAARGPRRRLVVAQLVPRPAPERVGHDVRGRAAASSPTREMDAARHDDHNARRRGELVEPSMQTDPTCSSSVLTRAARGRRTAVVGAAEHD